MRNLALFALATLASTAIAQSPLVTLTGGTNGGNVGGGVYFDLQVNTTITLTQIAFRTGGATVAGTNAFVDLYLGPSTYFNNVTNAALWTLVGSTVPVAVVAGAQAIPATNIVPVSAIPAVTLAPGNYGFALKSNGHSHGYTNGNGTATPGSGTNQTFSTAELTLRAGAAQNAFLAGAAFAPRVFNGEIHYTLGGTPITFAQREPYGAGCYRSFRSFYEFYPSSVAVDMSNRSMYLTFDSANNRYSSIALGTTPPNLAAVTSASLGHTDDSNITINLANGQPILFPNIGGVGVATTTVEMCSNMYVNLLGTVAPASNPTVNDWLTGAAVRIGNHHDTDPASTVAPPGTTHYDYDAANAAHLFTWNGVPDWNIAASSNTLQLAFFANGDVEFRYGAMSQLGGGGWPTLIGFSPGATSADPGSIDLTAALPISTQGIDQPPLALNADVNPVLGTTVNLTTSNETGLSLGVCFVSVSDLPPFSPVGLDLGIIGAGGCVANVDTGPAVGILIGNLPTFTMTVPFAIPAGPLSIVGSSFYSQSAWLDAAANAAGIITSNAVRLRVGSF